MTQRIFRYNSIELEDPGPEHDPVDVRNLYSATYPEILNAAIEGPEKDGDKVVYTFRRAVGTKGAGLRERLESIAAGKPQPAQQRGLDPALVKKHADDFGAWGRFAEACTRSGGSRLAAPAEVLAPIA